MSIHPGYAEAIMDGRKRVEFRKRRVATDVSHVAVYATLPVGALVGVFSVDGQDAASPDELWRRYESVGGIGEEDFRAYYADADEGVGIRVGSVDAFPIPLPLSALGANLHPPQSFAYLSEEQVERLAAHRMTMTADVITSVVRAIRSALRHLGQSIRPN